MKWEPRRAEGWNLLSDDGNIAGMVRPVDQHSTATEKLFVGAVGTGVALGMRREIARHTNPAIVRQAVWDEVKRMVIAEAVEMLADDDDVPQAGPG